MTAKKLIQVAALTAMVALTSSCAQMAELERKLDTAFYNVVGKPLEYLEDSIRGYRVDYVTIPAGAELTCEGEDLGRTPLRKWYDLTDEQKKDNIFTTPNCLVRWESGAAAEINTEVPLDKYPRRLYIVKERPSAYSGEEMDIQFGTQYLAYRQQQIEQAAVAIVGMASALHSASKSSSSSTSFGAGGPLDIPRFQSIQGSDGISWNWVSAGEGFGLGGNAHSHQGSRSLTPVAPASSCSGTIVMGKCSGTIINPGVQSFCAGSVINGRCVGSVIFGE
ncbi:hypothetical protein [Halomonas sp. BC04]|uniref:hypothetical protein n=1 Tax=Halomonas sp. BC04 TaxID=1403540 RepID=UPI0012DD4005|nr:hypothetical protein [Halomonas sp. BC04]